MAPHWGFFWPRSTCFLLFVFIIQINKFFSPHSKIVDPRKCQSTITKGLGYVTDLFVKILGGNYLGKAN